MAKTLHPEIALPGWDGYRGYAACLKRNPTGTNIGILIGHFLWGPAYGRTSPVGKQ